MPNIAANAPRVAGITITVQKGHVSDEQPRQAARDAGQVEQFDVRYFLLLVDVQPLHLGYDVQSAAERKAAEFQELYEEPESASGLFHCASPHARKGKAYTWCKVKRFFRPASQMRRYLIPAPDSVYREECVRDGVSGHRELFTLRVFFERFQIRRRHYGKRPSDAHHEAQARTGRIIYARAAQASLRRASQRRSP